MDIPQGSLVANHLILALIHLGSHQVSLVGNLQVNQVGNLAGSRLENLQANQVGSQAGNLADIHLDSQV